MTDKTLTSSRGPSPIEEACRSLKLQAFVKMFSFTQPMERRKVALFRHRGVAALQCLLHVPPLAGAVTLLALNWSGYVVGPEFTWSSQLQFLAKYHEVLMQASLGEILLEYIRSYTCDDGIPFGFLFAPVYITHISYFWSREFWSSIMSTALQKWRKFVLVSAVVGTIILGLIVGPSSAIVMIPRTMNLWKETYVYTPGPDSKNPAFSTHLEADKDLDWQFPGTNTLLESSMIDRSKSKYREKHWFLSRSARATRIIIDASMVGGNAPGKQPVGQVSGPSFQLSNFLSAAMKSFEWDATAASGDALQPLVMASCIWNPSFQINSTYASVRFPDQEGSSYRLLELYDERTWNHYSPSWFAPPEDMKHSLLGVFPHANEVDWAKNPPPNSAWTNAHGCTIDAYWNQARYELPSSSIGPPTIFSTSRTNSSYRGSLIEISPSFAYSKLSTMDWYWADSPPSDNITLLLLDEINSYGEVMLALSLFNILQTYPASFSYEDSYSSIPANNVVFPFEIVRTVYGYETTSATVVLSLMVLGIYSLLSLVYMLFILVTGRTSTAWSSAAELCTLALQSRKPDHLGHVGVGIETMATFKEGVFIRINKNNEPELLFKGDRDVQSDGNSRLELNKAY